MYNNEINDSKKVWPNTSVGRSVENYYHVALAGEAKLVGMSSRALKHHEFGSGCIAGLRVQSGSGHVGEATD